MKDSQTPASGLLYEMLRSFVSLAETLNLSRTVAELGSTRQTVRRHIAILEEARGHSLFEVVDRQYVLTDRGQQALPEAEELLQRGQAWFEARLGHIDGLQSFNHVAEGKVSYHAQQHGLSKLWQSPGGVLQGCVEAWSRARGQLDSPHFEETRTLGLTFREMQGRWLIADIGERSAFARWFGPTWARSSVGTAMDSLPGGERFNAVTARTYADVATHHGLRYDHVVAGFVGGPDASFNVIAFERLLMGSFYPDNSFALFSIARITPDIDIVHMPDDMRERIAGDARLQGWAAEQP